MGLLIKLQNGDTALKSLKFGHDRPGGGDSGQPYIKTPIDRPDTPTLNSDFLLRGGISAPLDAAEDVARLTKYFFDFKNPSGLLFTAKQNLLSRVAPKTEASFGPAYGGFSKDINPKTGVISQNQSNGFFNEGVYTPLSTIAEAGIVAFGGHLNKQGLDPTGLFPTFSIRKYGDIAFTNNQPEKNSEDPKVPLSLWRKSQNASDKAGRKLAQAYDQEIKTKSELAVNVSVPTIPNGSLSEFNNNSISKSKFNQFLQKWDAYRDKQAVKKLNKKDEAASKALDKQAELFQQVTNAENAPKTYANRLLNLWNLNGLNLTNPFSTNTPVLFSYSGGPNSILGVGNTDIKFATLGDGLTPIRTNNLPIDEPYEPRIYYSTTNIFGDEKSSVSLRYAAENTSITDYDLFGEDNFLETYNGTTNERLGITTNPVANDFYSNPIDAKTRNSDNTKASYFSPINEKLVEFGRQLITDSAYNPISGYFEATDPDPQNPTILGGYSSKNTLATDDRLIDNSDGAKISILNGGATGYLANLNKNAGTYLDANGNTIVKNNNPPRDGGGRGISVDFRKVNRDVRGFYDDPKAYDYISDPSEYNNKTAIDTKVYYNSSDKRESKELFTDFNDLIEFNFTIVDPTLPSSPGLVLDFRAYIDSFSDSYSNDWKSQTYMGRAEKQYKYNSFDREISLAFTIVADNLTNLEQMYSQLNTLASSIAPKYTSQGYMVGVLHKLTVGNYVNKQYGILQGLTFEVTEETPWQIDEGSQLPLYIKVSGIKFVPIHNFRPEVNLNKNLVTNASGQKYFVPAEVGSQSRKYISQAADYSDEVPTPQVTTPTKPKSQTSQPTVTSNMGSEVGIQLNSVFNL
jgi:hypothetical protein